MRTVVVLPTYNERENIGPFLRAVRRASGAIDVLVVDDSSPDGTGDAARSLARTLGGITVVDRVGARGLGSAYRDGFARALAAGYDVIVSMDADLSHDPAELPTILRQVGEGADVVVGSRYVAGGGTTADWPIHRRLLSRWGNRYTRFVLRIPLADCTSGFRAYRAEALASIEPHTTTAEGYAFLTELARRAARHGLVLAETPIMFRDRAAGESKMSGRIIVESMALVTRWAIGDLVARRPITRSSRPER